MPTIWKTTLKVGEQDIEVPAGATMLCVMNQLGQMAIWYQCNPDAPKVQRRITVVGTGGACPHPNTHKYIGSVTMQEGHYIWHAFELMLK